MAMDTRLARLLEHPAIWRGRSAARTDTHSTGFRELDAGLPGGGWPRAGLIEILTPRHGVGELRLVMPLLAQLSGLMPARWATWVAPPFEPYAPALVEHGLALERQLVVRTEAPLWAMEQALGSGACEVVLAWARRARATSVRRLQLATERGRTAGFLFRATVERRRIVAGRAAPAVRAHRHRRAVAVAQEPRWQSRRHRAELGGRGGRS